MQKINTVKKVHGSKEFTPLFACSEPSPICYMVPCVYKVILNSLKEYKILVLYRFFGKIFWSGSIYVKILVSLLIT